MAMEEFNKKKNDLEEQKAEAEASFDGEKVGELEKAMADLEATKSQYEGVAEVAKQGPTDNQVNQITALGGDTGELDKRLEGNKDEVKKTEEVVQEKIPDGDIEHKVGEELEPGSTNEEVKQVEGVIQEKTENIVTAPDSKIEAKEIDLSKMSTDQVLEAIKTGQIDLKKIEPGSREYSQIQQNLEDAYKSDLFKFTVRGEGSDVEENQNAYKFLRPEEKSRLEVASLGGAIHNWLLNPSLAAEYSVKTQEFARKFPTSAEKAKLEALTSERFNSKFFQEVYNVTQSELGSMLTNARENAIEDARKEETKELSWRYESYQEAISKIKDPNEKRLLEQKNYEKRQSIFTETTNKINKIKQKYEADIESLNKASSS